MTDSRNLLVLVLLAAIGHFMIDFMLSIWPVYKTMAGVDLAIAGLITVIAVIVGELSQLPFGKLIDKGYQKILFSIGILLASMAALLPYGSGYVFYFALLLAIFIGSAAFHPTAASILGGIESSHKALLLGFFQMSGNFGMGLGQLLFSSTYKVLDGNTLVMAIPAIILILFMCALKIRLPETPVQKEKISLRSVFAFFKHKGLRSLYFVQVANQVILWSTIFLLPDFLVSRGYSEQVAFGGGHFTFLLGAAFGCMPAGYIATRFSISRVMLAGFVVGATAFYSLLAYTVATPLLSVLLFTIGLSLGCMTPLALSLGCEIEPHKRGLVSAFLMGMVWIVSEGVGIGTSGILADLFTHDAPAKALACIGSFLFVGIYFALQLVSYEEAMILKTAVEDGKLT